MTTDPTVQDRRSSPDQPARELLRSLLPEFYWARDEAAGNVLGALVDALAVVYRRVHEEVEGLYDDLFIETCNEAIVPYIGDGVGVEGLAPITGPGVSHRAWVGQVIGLRRRKGTLATVGRGVAAGTGWAAYVQDGRAVVARAQAVDNLHLDAGRTVDVTEVRALAELGEPWSRSARGAAVAGFPAPRAVEVAVYRLEAFSVDHRTAARVDGVRGAFTFHPLARSMPLFVAPAPPPEADGPPRADDMPRPLTRSELARRLRGADWLPFAVRRAGSGDLAAPVHAGAMTAADLSDWRPPRGRHRELLVDPELGRLLFTGDALPLAVDVDYSYGLAGELGGGPYLAAGERSVAPDTLELTVGSSPGAHTLAAALAFARRAEATSTVIVLPDDSTSSTPAGEWVVEVAAGATLRIEAAVGAAPVLDGRLLVLLGRRATVVLRGLLVGGSMRIAGSGDVRIEHSTFAPHRAEPSVEIDGGGIRVSCENAIVGGIVARRRIGEPPSVDARATIVDGGIALESGTVDVGQTTVLGGTEADVVLAESCIFTEPVVARHGREGQVRFSYVPPGSDVRGPALCVAPGGGRLSWLTEAPRFTSTRYGDSGYGQLALSCPPSIAAGAEAGGEMGVFNWLVQPDRFARLPLLLQELLPVDVSASVTFRT
jgi:hypothetical protein